VESSEIILRLPADLVEQAKVYADEHHTTVDALVRDLLQETLSPQLEEELSRERARAAVERLIALAGRGPFSTIDPGSIRREEIYERR
jgi:plasmid stability protein